MARVRDYQLSREEKHILLKKFFTCVATLKNYEEASSFFKDLLHAEETIMLARRLKAAQLLEQGCTFHEVSKKMKMSETTIAKINFWLHYGRGGYMNAVLKLDREERRDKHKRIRKAKLQEPFSSDWLEQKYNYFNLDDLDDFKNEIIEYIKIRKTKKYIKRMNEKMKQ